MTEKSDFDISDMSCASCAQTIEDNLNSENRINSANVNFADDRAIVEHESELDRADIINIIENAGYNVVEEDEEQEGINYRKESIKAWTLTAPIMVMMVLNWVDIELISDIYVDLSYLIISSIVILYIGRHTHISAYQGLKNNRKFNMDSLISIGTLAALMTGIMVFSYPIENYAGVGSMIMASHLVGTHLEERAKGKASSAIESLMSLRAEEATIVDNDDQTQVPIDSLEIDDIVLVKPGEKIPMDGIVIEGETDIDESMVTGEPKPMSKEEGDEVIGGTINNTGSIKVRVTKTGDDTFLSEVVDLVKEAQGTKVPIQSLTNKVTHYFVPTVLLLSILTFVSWIVATDTMIGIASSIGAESLPWVSLALDPFTLAVFATVAVLVIACPCALGLATPTALMTGTGKAAQNGVIYRDGESIQTMTEIDCVILDKTGTITKGEPEVQDIVSTDGYDKNKMMRMIAGAESRSEHHIANSIMDYVRIEDIEYPEPDSFESLTGKGVKAKFGGDEVIVGNRSFLNENNITNDLDEDAKDYENRGHTVVFVAINKDLKGFISIADTLKRGSKMAIKQMKDMGLEIWMITGDNERTANAIAEEVGIDKVLSEALPKEKLRKTEELQSENKKVAMVGDGINDAPALEKSNVGIAIGTGTDIAIESADVSLVKGELTDLVDAFELSNRIFGTIKQNLAWAFVYNLIAIPIAFIGLLHPVIAVVAMFASSLSVIGNSLRLR